MHGLNLLGKCFKGAAIAYRDKGCAPEINYRHIAGGVDLSQSLLDARVGLNLHRVDAALVRCQDRAERARRRSESGKKGPR